MVIWDEPLDYIMAFRTVDVGPGQTVNLGDVGVFRWFGWTSGHVFFDANGDGIRDPGEGGVPNQGMLIHYRDGSIHQGSVTDSSGYYEFPEHRGPLGKWELLEVDFARFAVTGHSVHDEQWALFGQEAPIGNRVLVDPEVGGGIILNQLTIEGRRSIVDFGKQPYTGANNGGISGIVFYAVTRNEFDARLALAEDYEPGIPNVTLRLYGLGPDGLPNTADDVLLQETVTDSYQQPRASNPENPVACDVRDKDGNIVPGSTPNYVAIKGVVCLTPPGSRGTLLSLRPLRTARETFASSRSSRSNAR
jgi:hypothetical protein